MRCIYRQNSGGHYFLKWNLIIFENGGIIFENGGTIFENGGIIFENGGIIFENGGIILEIGGIIFENGGIIFENGDIILEIEGTIFENGGIFGNAYSLEQLDVLPKWVFIMEQLDVFPMIYPKRNLKLFWMLGLMLVKLLRCYKLESEQPNVVFLNSVC